MTVSQQFVVATDGTDGDTVNFAFVRVPEGTSASSVTAATDGTENTPANFLLAVLHILGAMMFQVAQVYYLQ